MNSYKSFNENQCYLLRSFSFKNAIIKAEKTLIKRIYIDAQSRYYLKIFFILVRKSWPETKHISEIIKDLEENSCLNEKLKNEMEDLIKIHLNLATTNNILLKNEPEYVTTLVKNSIKNPSAQSYYCLCFGCIDQDLEKCLLNSSVHSWQPVDSILYIEGNLHVLEFRRVFLKLWKETTKSKIFPPENVILGLVYAQKVSSRRDLTNYLLFFSQSKSKVYKVFLKKIHNSILWNTYFCIIQTTNKT